MTPQDKEKADELESLANFLNKIAGDEVLARKLNFNDYVIFISALRYAISKLRGG